MFSAGILSDTAVVVLAGVLSDAAPQATTLSLLIALTATSAVESGAGSDGSARRTQTDQPTREAHGAAVLPPGKTTISEGCNSRKRDPILRRRPGLSSPGSPVTSCGSTSYGWAFRIGFWPLRLDRSPYSLFVKLRVGLLPGCGKHPYV
jgi:hypothetical protein